ncbi:MAG: transcription antitermination factor NusB [Terriglobales bacterium]
MITGLAAREAALQMLYALDLDRGAQTAREVAHWYLQAHPLPAAAAARAQELVAAVEQQRGEIERLISKHAVGWRLERMSVVDRNVLKLATAEFLLAPQAAARTAIQPARKLAQKFSQPEAVQFIQGLLEAIARDLASPSPTPAEVAPHAES